MKIQFITTDELHTAILDYQLDQITTDDIIITQAISASIAEATSY